MKKIACVSLFLIFLMASNGFCLDTIYFKNGRTIQGEIIQETPYSVKIRKSGGAVDAFYSDEIDRIERGKQSDFEAIQSPEGEVVFPELALISEKKKSMIMRLLKVSGVYESVEATMDSIVKNLSKDKEEEIRKVLSVDELVQQIVPIYAAYYNEEEIAVLTDYYGNSTIQKNMRLTPKILEAALNEVMKHLSQKMQTLSP